MIRIYVKILIVLIFCLNFLTTASFAFNPNYNPSLLEDMKNNPSNYIALGGIGSGAATFLVKDSVNVHKYNPPHYIIAFERVNVYNHPDGNGKWINDAEAMGLERYYYNLDEKKMYRESILNDKVSWQYLEAKLESNSLVVGGEIAFYLAYDMYFYGEPRTHFGRVSKGVIFG